MPQRRQPGLGIGCMSGVASRQRESVQLELLFNRAFRDSFNTLLVGGADEPLYRPADGVDDCHRLFYREDYFSSALHEIAHWCIAGEARRQQLDFGYWYNPDGRTSAQQRAFEQVEIRPQALEWIFSIAAGIAFFVSADNLSADDEAASGPSREFLLAVEDRAREYCRHGLPPRAEKFARALQQFYGTGDPLDEHHYRGGPSR